MSNEFNSENQFETPAKPKSSPNRIKNAIVGVVMLCLCVTLACGASTPEAQATATARAQEQEATRSVSTVIAAMEETEEARPTETPVTSNNSEEQLSVFTLLMLDEINFDGENIIILGSTDLPDGAILDVTFDITSYSSPEDTYIGVSTQVEALNGQFIALIKPPGLPEYEVGPYEVDVRFRPNSPFGSVQPSEIENLVGKGGENLSGENVEQLHNGLKILVDTEIVDLPLIIQYPTYPQIDASLYPADSPERAVAEYLLAWQDLDWQRMANFTQKTWQEEVGGLEGSAEMLMLMYDFKNLLGAEIREKYHLNEEVFGEGNFVSIDVIIYYSIRPTEVETRIIRPNAIREIGPLEPSPLGEWGVNPDSTLKEEEVK